MPMRASLQRTLLATASLILFFRLPHLLRGALAIIRSGKYSTKTNVSGVLCTLSEL